MNIDARHTHRLTPAGWLLCLLPVLGLPACSLIYEDLSDCLYGTGIRFEYRIYDDDGGWADGFAQSVDRVALYIFDDRGQYVATRTEAGATLRNPAWRMTLDLDPGRYQLIAWAGADGRSFAVPPVCATPAEVTAQLQCDDGGAAGSLSHSDLRPLWHGAADIVVERDYTEHTVSLVKDTRRIRVVLQQINGLPVDAAHFDFSIADDNALLGHDNRPVPGHAVTYRPYDTGSRQVGEGTGAVTVAYADLSTSRLVAGNAPRLRIYRTTDDVEIVDIPLLDYLYLYRNETGGRLGDQQFLDREDTYTLVFFLDRNFSWLKTQIIINDWTIRLNSGIL